MKRLSEHSLAGRFLTALAHSVIRHRRAWLYSQILLFALCVFYTIENLQFNTRRDRLVGPNKRYHENWMQFRKEFPTQDDLVVVVESEDSEKNRQFVERLGARMEAETNLFRNVFYRGDLKMLGSKALLFVPDANLKELKRTLADYQPFIEHFTRATNLVSLFDTINTQFRTARQEDSERNRGLMRALPALERILAQARDALRRQGVPPSPGINALFDPGAKSEKAIYITFADGRIFLVTAQAPVEALNRPALARLRTLVEEVRAEVPGLNVGVTGEPVLELDEMAQSQKDTMLASVVSLVLCALIFIYGYQETGRPVKATLCLVMGLGYTLAFATLAVGHLNILTITFVPILIGLAIDYGVHLIARYEEELRHGKSEEAALVKAMVFTGQGIFTGAFTTAGAFLAMSFTNFRGIQEMGIICGGGLLVCLVPMMTVLPVLLLRGRQNVIDHVQGDLESTRERIENLWLERPVWTIGITVILCALAASQLPKVYFDYNLLNMQSEGLPAVEFEKKLIYATNSVSGGTNAPNRSLLYAAVVATNLEHAVALEARLTNLPSVSTVESITRFLASDQRRKLPMVDEIKAEVAGTKFAERDVEAVNLNELSRTLWSFAGYLGAASDVARKQEPEVARQLESILAVTKELRKEMLAGGPLRLERNADTLGHFQRALFEDVRGTFEAIRGQDTSGPLRVEDLPTALRDRFVGVTGKYLVMIMPRKDVWDRENQRELLQEVRAVDPEVTGTPVQLYEYTNLLKRSYEEAAWYSLAAILVLVLIHFRSVGSVFLAMVPVAVGSLWLGGLMGYFGIPFNPANIMTLPLVIGIGVTNGVHILNRFAEERTPSILARSTGKAVLISGLTSIAGFGSLILAEHRGISSLGYLMSIGLATCMISGLTFLPAILNVMSRRERPEGNGAQPQ